MPLLRSRIPRRWGSSAVGAALSVFLGLCFLVPLIGQRLINLSYDLSFLFRRNIPVEEAVVVYMDLESHTRLKQDKSQRWDRRLHARLIDRLMELKARAVVFDVVFRGTGDAAADAELVKAAARSGRVVVAAMVESRVLQGQPFGLQLKTPFPELEAVASWGLVAVSLEDSLIRTHYHMEKLDAPGLGWRAAQRTMTNTPPDPFQERWLNYYGPPGMLPHYSFWEVLDTNDPLPANAFSNRVVFVGAHYEIGTTGGKDTDSFPTPYSRWSGTVSPGVEIIATTFLNVIHGDWLKRASAPVELALILLAGGVFGFLLATLRPMWAAGIGLAGAVGIGVIANVAVWQTHVWFPWLIVSAVQVPAAVGWSILAHTRRLVQEKRALEAALAIAASRERAAVPASPAPAQPAASATETIRSAGGAAVRPESRDLGIPNHTLVRKIGEGAYGEVWLARDIIGSYHAAKFVHRWHFSDAAPFEREFNGIRRFTPISRGHPGLVQVLHIGRNESPEYIYYVMELGDDEVSGQRIVPETYSPRNLAKELEKRNALSLPESVAICLQLADALAYLHSHDLIHRDIKPSNIIFVNGVAKLADIGLVTQVAAAGRDVSYLGTEGYIPPEGPGTPGADVFSLGKVIYQAATGFHIGRFPELPSAVMEGTVDIAFMELNRVIMKACEVDSENRYRSGGELYAALTVLQQKVKDRPGAPAR